MFIGAEQITYIHMTTGVPQTTTIWLADNEVVDWDDNQQALDTASDVEIAAWQGRKTTREDEIFAHPSLKLARDREQAAWEVLRQDAEDAGTPFDTPRPPDIVAPEPFGEVQPEDYVVTPELPYVTRGKEIRARLKTR